MKIRVRTRYGYSRAGQTEVVYGRSRAGSRPLNDVSGLFTILVTSTVGAVGAELINQCP